MRTIFESNMVSAKFGIPRLAIWNRAAGLKIAEVFLKMLLNISKKAHESVSSLSRVAAQPLDVMSRLTRHRGEIGSPFNVHEIDTPDGLLQQQKVPNEEQLSIELTRS